MEPQAPIRQKIIREIKPSPVLQARTRNHRLRVAAYCRVSTEQEEQQTSIENQITYYDDLIRSNPEWEYAGVFSDDGISGTSVRNVTRWISKPRSAATPDEYWNTAGMNL